jgi:hypothetical protein
MVPQFGLHKNDGRKGTFIFNIPYNNNDYKFNKFEIFLNFIFQNHTRGKPYPHLRGWIAIMRNFQGNFNIGLHGGHKKLKLLVK